MTNEDWITDRLPTEADGDNEGKVWVSTDGAVLGLFWAVAASEGLVWMPITKPALYIAPKPDTSLAASLKRSDERGYKKPDDHNDGCCCPGCDRHRIIEAARIGQHLLNIRKRRIETASSFTDGDTSLESSIRRRSLRIEFLRNGFTRDEWASDVAGCSLSEDCKCEVCDDERINEAARKWDTFSMVSVTTPATNNSGDKAEAPVVSSGGNDPDGVGEGWRVLRHGELTQPGDVYKNHNGILCEFGPTGWPVGYQTIYRRRIATPVIVAGGTPDDPYNKKLLDSIQGSNEALESDPDWRPDGVDHKSVLGKKMNEAIEKAKEHMEGKEPNLNRYAEHRASEPQGKQDEWWLDTSWGSDRLYAYDCKTTNGIHVRRVNDAMDEWTAKLIELCHEACECGDEDDEHDCIIAVDAHMKARPQ